jgi:hypothetical protein
MSGCIDWTTVAILVGGLVALCYLARLASK